MKYECTDCKHCADFCDGWRVVCYNSSVDIMDMFEYPPIGDKDALTCEGFEEGCGLFFWSSAYNEAEAWAESQAPDGEATWELMRQWCLQKGVT